MISAGYVVFKNLKKKKDSNICERCTCLKPSYRLHFKTETPACSVGRH